MSENEVYLTPLMKKELREIFNSILGENGVMVLTFHLRRYVGEDPLKSLIEYPHEFYRGLVEVYESGADAMIMLLAETLSQRYGLNLDSRKFLLLMKNADPKSRESIRRIWVEVVRISLQSKGGLDECGEI